ncbi:unnamed protein product [Amaranthus hypochondriacus]
MSRPLAAIVGGAAGAVAFLGIVVILFWFCLFHRKSASRTSETGSSEPYPDLVDKSAAIELSFREAKRFDWEELCAATKNFNEQGSIGIGKFGEVYKGLLTDGVLVAIKKRSVTPTPEFVEEVRYLSSIHHRNIVTLLGYFQDNNQQILVYEYIVNGSVAGHLYGAPHGSHEKLEFKHRLSIALGAAKGLDHLHSLSPRLLHKDFKTSNVLVDENFVAKVADAGTRNFLGRYDAAGSTSQLEADEIFLAPEVKEFKQFSEKSDVYSFGVFLLELVCGQEAGESYTPESNQNLVERILNYHDFSTVSTMVDPRMGNRFTVEGMEEFVQLIVRCIDPSSELRPGIKYVVSELDQILEKEMNLTSSMGEAGTPTVTLGSQLFRAMR